NSVGQVVVSGNANGRTALNVNGLNGVYFLRIIADGDVIVRKVTVK
ncbi:MAG: T9SS type A sorting domain-containing protein, partial [Bacteroidales bacterium]|nr:T9SS type A sorting domain-containing protein [Bacteroidales bacterium]MBR6439092.1 T9SS type A sorting domain-containing protein [Bacteroidales bacterium]